MLQREPPQIIKPTQQLQVLLTNALQSVLPPNSTISSMTMVQQLSNDTIIVNSQFSLWESQVPILLANKCCALQVLYLQHAVQRIAPSAIGKTLELLCTHVQMLCSLAT